VQAWEESPVLVDYGLKPGRARDSHINIIFDVAVAPETLLARRGGHTALLQLKERPAKSVLVPSWDRQVVS
jgi:hypothetical protein